MIKNTIYNATLFFFAVLGLGACGGEQSETGSSSSSSSSSSSASSSSSSSGGDTVSFTAISNEYTHLNTNTLNALYRDSQRFRIYYAGSDLLGGDGNLAVESDRNIEIAFAHLEAAYEYFVNDWGFRSPSLSVNSDVGPFYKLNLYSTTTLNAGGAMGADARAGLSFIEVKEGLTAEPGIVVHEFGHCLTYTEYNWVDQQRTGAWWETVANWVADTYITSSAYEGVRQKYGLAPGNSIIDLDSTIARSYLTIVHADNRYPAWPFLTYLTNNPDDFNGLGKMVVPEMIRNHARNNETPLHVLERMVQPVKIQDIVGLYWARMAYLDIEHPKAQQQFFTALENADFKARAFGNWDALGEQRYRVKTQRQPMYGGANITPLDITGNGTVNIQIFNLGNGLEDSDLTATLSIYDTLTRQVRYLTLEDDAGQAIIGRNEEVSLVVVNTPRNLYLYDAFASGPNSPELVGLNYEVNLSGAVPSF